VAGALLATKLHIPRRRTSLVLRARLTERLGRAGEASLTLVSAPAGFGKTTLLVQWLAGDPPEGRAVAWLSLDRRDNDPAVFWAYFVAALRTAAPGVGVDALSLLQSPQPTTEAVLATLVNELSALAQEVLLVLDDFHVIDAREVQDGMAFLLENLPPQLHLVIAGRADPALPLARLRGRGELVEVRAADLRFTPAEAAEYLTGTMGLALTAGDVAALEGRTEGWIAALQLAALSLQGRDDVTGFIAGFTGDDRYIVDYLIEEVLQRQPDEVRTFLLQTSILGRLTGSLCDAVTGVDGGTAMLERLDRANLFVVPLDDQRRWYRYHHLFSDMLHARLLDEHPGLAADLHLRASEWYEQHSERHEAIRHALAGEHSARAADLVELALPSLLQGRQEATVRRWLEALPDELIEVRPVLSVGYAGSLMVRGEIEGVESRLRDAERWLDGTSGTDERTRAERAQMVVVDGAALGRLPSSIAGYRAAQALIRGDVSATMTHARLALDLADADNHLGRGSASALLGLAHWTIGDLEAARRWYVGSIASLEKAEHLSDVLGCSIALADILIRQGRLHEATATYSRGLRAAYQAVPTLRGAADMHVGMSELLRERNHLDSARAHLRESSELGEHAGLPQNRYRWRVAMARLRQVDGDLGGAVQLLDEAERLYVGDFSPDVRPVASIRARVLVAQGELGAALGWARERGISADDAVTYLHEHEHLTLARVLVAQHAREREKHYLDEATGLLERLLRAADEGERTGSVIEILVLQALSLQSRGDTAAALAALRRALTLAEPEGYVRIFVDEGAPMTALLTAAAKQGVGRASARRLLAAVVVGATPAPTHTQQELIEPLSRRELEVLRLLASDLDGPDIARELSISLSTVRTHTKNIFAKLGVNARRAAVRRAQELRLLP